MKRLVKYNVPEYLKEFRGKIIDAIGYSEKLDSYSFMYNEAISMLIPKQFTESPEKRLVKKLSDNAFGMVKYNVWAMDAKYYYFKSDFGTSMVLSQEHMEDWVDDEVWDGEKWANNESFIIAKVYNGKPMPNSNPVVHPTEASALKEANRLATNNKNIAFEVYKRITSVEVKEEKPFDVKKHKQYTVITDKIPFVMGSVALLSYRSGNVCWLYGILKCNGQLAQHHFKEPEMYENFRPSGPST